MSYYLLLAYLGFVIPTNGNTCEEPQEPAVVDDHSAYVAPVIYLEPELINLVSQTKPVSTDFEKETTRQIFTIKK